ncbi:MAG: zinc-binding dehydrogenase [Dehalococcoidia bacterium]
MADTMKAALDQTRRQYKVKQVPMPDRFRGSALVRVRKTGICGSDLHMTNERKEPQSLPSGHEVAGEVVEAPPGQHRIRPGDRVAIEMIGAGRACMECYYCRYGQYRHCRWPAPDTGGGFAEYMTRRPEGLFKLTDNLDWADGALVEPLAVSVHGLRLGGMKPGDTVAVVGSATIGLAAIVAARAFGAARIIASARHPQQAEAAKTLGADMVTGSGKGELEDAVRNATGGLGADVTVESIGGTKIDTLQQSVDSTRPQGKVIVLGGFRDPLQFDFLKPMLNEVALVFTTCYGVIDGKHDYEVAIDLLAKGGIPFRKIVTHTYSLDDIQKGFDTAYNKSSGSIKVHITP